MIPVFFTYNPYTNVEFNAPTLTTQIEDLSSFTRRNGYYENEDNFIVESLSLLTTSVIYYALTTDKDLRTNTLYEDIDNYLEVSLGVISKKTISKDLTISSIRKLKPKLVV